MGKTAHRAGNRGKLSQRAADVGNHRDHRLVHVVNAFGVLDTNLVLFHRQILNVLVNLDNINKIVSIVSIKKN